MQIELFLLQTIDVFRNILIFAIFGRIILSWVMAYGGKRIDGPIARLLYDMTEPLYRIARRIPHRVGMFDLSPIYALLGIDLLAYLLSMLILNIF